MVSAGTLGNRVGPEALTEFVESFEPIPTSSVGIVLPNTASVAIDNHAGVREALLHLIQEGGRRRIAFIRGPEGNREAEERYRVYRDGLRSHGLELNPDLITLGNFDAASGYAAVRTLIDDRHAAFDAVLAASDLMALGALNALLERGVAVPQKVAVVGFDDIEAARFATAPLTTVRQPLIELGKRALENVINQIFQSGNTTNVVLPARLIRRESSRLPRDDTAVTHSSLPDTSLSDSLLLEEGYRAKRESLHQMLHAIAPQLQADASWCEQLCVAFIADVCKQRRGLLKRTSFIEVLEHLVLAGPRSNTDSGRFQELVSTLRRELRPLLRNDSALSDDAENLWHLARTRIGNISERLQVQQRLQLSHWRSSVRTVGAHLLRASTWTDLSQRLAEMLPSLAIPACAVCTIHGETSRLRAAADQGVVVEVPQTSFPSTELLPGDALQGSRRRTLLIDVMYEAEAALGYVVFEMGPADAETYSVLRDYIHGAVRGFSAG